MRDNKGFTLIELLVVVVVLGILAAIAIPKFSAAREKAYFAAVKSDVKNLASQQEIYYAENQSYTTSTVDLAFVESDGVNLSVTASLTGWSATATHDALLSSQGCAIYYGSATPPTSPVTPAGPGQIACTG
jgi:prepilin-type N-terminal cleavage/methylation domain-containing protein